MTQTIARSAAGQKFLYRPYRTLAGLSAGPTSGQIGGAIVSGGTGIATAIAAGASLTIPIIGAAIGAVALGIEAILNSGCGSTCIVTSNWANQAEALLQQNIAEYFAIPAPRPQSAQTAALANYASVWNYLVQQCSAASLGTAGQNCIGDRQAGACKWKASPPQYPGEPAAGACWNWDNAYRAPIANDPNVISDAAYTASLPSSSAATSSTSAASSSSSPLSSSSSIFLIAGAALLLFGFMGGNN